MKLKYTLLLTMLLTLVVSTACFADQIRIPVDPDADASYGAISEKPKRKNADLNGIIVLDHNEAGGYYGLRVASRKKNPDVIPVIYLFELHNEETQSNLQHLVDTQKGVRVMGTLDVYKGGSKGFYHGKPVLITWQP